MSKNHEEKVQHLVERVKHYGKPMLLFLRLITWELPLSWATVYAACSILYVILYNLSIKTFSVLGLLSLWLDYYCTQNNIVFSELTNSEKEQLRQVCSKLITVQTMIEDFYQELKTAKDQNPYNFFHQSCLILTIAIVASWFIENLLLSYLIGSTVLMMVGMSCPQTDSL